MSCRSFYQSIEQLFFVFSVAVYSVAMQYTAYLEVKPVHGLVEGFYREKVQIIH